jgi:adhesin/invasin
MHDAILVSGFTTMIALARFPPRRQPAVGFSRRTAIALGLLATVASAACDKVPLTAPTGATVTLFSNTTIVPVNGTAEITATVVESGGTLVQNGTLVTFTTTIGTLDPSEARTRDGKVTVRLNAGGRSGRAVVRAFSGGITSGDLSVDIGGAAAGAINLTANPSSVPSSGGTSTLQAIVFDVDGNRLPGVPVSFTSDFGTISSTVVVSDAQGVATTTITTNRDTTVTASAGGSGGGTGGSGGTGGTGGTTAAITATVKITAATLPTVTITASTTNPVADAPVTFTVNAAATSPATVRSVTVDFGDGSVQTFGNTTSVSHTYRSSGSTVVVVQPSDILVTLTVAPTVTTVSSVVTFTVALSQNPGNVPVQSVRFEFGDGAAREVDSLTTTYAYSSPGVFTARATVRLTNGRTAVGEAAVRVNP